jgi:hypothetical protein
MAMTPTLIRDDASAESRELLDAMMEAAASRAPVQPADLANAGFSAICHGLAHMQDTEERDALLNEFAAKARETVLANAAIAKHVGHEQKKH